MYTLTHLNNNVYTYITKYVITSGIDGTKLLVRVMRFFFVHQIWVPISIILKLALQLFDRQPPPSQLY